MRAFPIFASLAVLLGLTAPGLGGQTAPLRVELAQERLVLRPGQTAQIQARVLDANGNVLDEPLMYLARSGRGRLDVNRTTGAVEAVYGGEYPVIVMVASDRNVRADLTILVEYPPIERVVVEPGAGGRFYVGATVRHLSTVFDEAGDVRGDTPVTWSSSDASIATVDRFGVLTAHRPGRVTLTATAAGVEGRVAYAVQANPVTELALTGSQTVGRTGDVIHFTATAQAGSTPVTDIPVSYAVVSYPAPEATADVPAAEIDQEGRFVAYKPGIYTVMASVPGHSAHQTLQIEPRHVSEEVTFVGQGAVRAVPTSDLWVWEGVDGRDYAITGTWGAFGAAYFWDVTNPSSPMMTDSIVVDARTTNDVKVSEDGRICVISREGASNRRNGIVILDCSDPRNVEILSTFDDELTGGVHNLFIYQDHVYAVNNGIRFDVINIADPRNPHRVGRFELDTPGHAIHDVWVVDGIAYSSNWGDGVAVIDVGGGNKGGSPSNPVLMYRFADVGGATHAAFPYKSPTGKFYIFMGDEIGRPGFNDLDANRTPPRMAGYIHVVDFTDPMNPEEVARYEVPEAGSHNMWIEEDRLYAAFYNGGTRVIDISGELKGNLGIQGREIAHYMANDPDSFVPNAPFSWGPQMHKGNLFIAEHHSGLWAIKLQPRRGLIP
ncbi:MAG: Ig-like domain-containing protein [Gemmatimonadota bacterium]